MFIAAVHLYLPCTMYIHPTLHVCCVKPMRIHCPPPPDLTVTHSHHWPCKPTLLNGF